MGTKEWRDYLTDAAFHQGPMVLEADSQAVQVGCSLLFVIFQRQMHMHADAS